jgi:1,4-alpha-glucan branching enzyme
MLFQGQELLEQGSFRDTVPVDWSRADRFPGIFALYRDLVRLRRNLAGQTRGLLGPHINVFHLNERDKVIAFHRWRDGGPGDDVVVVASFSNRPFARYQIGLPRGGRWKVRFDSDALAYGPDHGGSVITEVDAVAGGRDGLAFTGDVVLGAYSAVILSQER